MQERLSQLRAKYEEGRRQMAALDRRRHDLRDTLLRIKGAIQILEELLANGSVKVEPSASPAEARDRARPAAS